MRLRATQAQTIVRLVRAYAGADCRVYLFGSRTDDKARGGDVDLIVETPAPVPRLRQARLKMDIEGRLGLPVDLIFRVENKPPSAFETIALKNAVPLEPAGAK